MIQKVESDGYIKIGFLKGKINEMDWSGMVLQYYNALYTKNNKLNTKKLKKFLEDAIKFIDHKKSKR